MSWSRLPARDLQCRLIPTRPTRSPGRSDWRVGLRNCLRQKHHRLLCRIARLISPAKGTSQQKVRTKKICVAGSYGPHRKNPSFRGLWRSASRACQVSVKGEQSGPVKFEEAWKPWVWDVKGCVLGILCFIDHLKVCWANCRSDNAF